MSEKVALIEENTKVPKSSGFWFFEDYLSKEHSAEFSSFSLTFLQNYPKANTRTLSSKAMASAFSNAVLLIVVVSVFNLFESIIKIKNESLYIFFREQSFTWLCLIVRLCLLKPNRHHHQNHHHQNNLSLKVEF